MVAAIIGAAVVIWSQPTSGTDRTAQGFLGEGLGAWPRGNITASSPNNGGLNDFGARPCLLVTAAQNCSRPRREALSVSVSGAPPVIRPISAILVHILSASSPSTPRLVPY